MAERKAVTKAVATRYRRVDEEAKSRILDEVCAMTGWHRDHARKALRSALRPRVVQGRAPRPAKYGPKVIDALIFCWAVLRALSRTLSHYSECVAAEACSGLLT